MEPAAGLSYEEINQLAVACLQLIAIAYVIRLLIRMVRR